MNKFLKASIAGGAAVALLLGGAGTLASWNATATVNGGEIIAGDLSVSGVGNAAWTVNGDPVADPATFRIVPGDVLVMTQPLRVVASGDSLKAKLAVEYTSLEKIPANNAGVELGSDVLKSGSPSFTFATTLPATQFTSVPGNVQGVPVQSLTLTPGATGIDTTVTATVKFTFPATSGNDTMNGQLNLNNIKLVLTQTT